VGLGASRPTMTALVVSVGDAVKEFWSTGKVSPLEICISSLFNPFASRTSPALAGIDRMNTVALKKISNFLRAIDGGKNQWRRQADMIKE
jgi:hypothetical protein